MRHRSITRCLSRCRHDLQIWELQDGDKGVVEIRPARQFHVLELVRQLEGHLPLAERQECHLCTLAGGIAHRQNVPPSKTSSRSPAVTPRTSIRTLIPVAIEPFANCSSRTSRWLRYTSSASKNARTPSMVT